MPVLRFVSVSTDWRVEQPMTASAGALRNAVTAAKGASEPIVLVVKRGDEFRTLSFDYHGGLRYPRLERVEGTPDRLGDILTPRRR